MDGGTLATKERGTEENGNRNVVERRTDGKHDVIAERVRQARCTKERTGTGGTRRTVSTMSKLVGGVVDDDPARDAERLERLGQFFESLLVIGLTNVHGNDMFDLPPVKKERE